MIAALAALLLAGIGYWSTRSDAPDSETARKLVTHCLAHPQAERCLTADDTKIVDLSRAKFNLFATHDSPSAVVAAYEFRTPDQQNCVYVEIGKEQMDWHRSTEFYRCANRKSAHLGLG